MKFLTRHTCIFIKIQQLQSLVPLTISGEALHYSTQNLKLFLYLQASVTIESSGNLCTSTHQD